MKTLEQQILWSIVSKLQAELPDGVQSIKLIAKEELPLHLIIKFRDNSVTSVCGLEPIMRYLQKHYPDVQE